MRIVQYRLITSRYVYRRSTKLRRANTSFVKAARPPARPPVRIEHLGSNWMDVRGICYLSIFRKSFQKI
jgi:hypothetical protein